MELERIPQDKKQALMEAQQKANADEFNNNRLERLLRCEGMNTKVRR
jgi:predicted transposase YdaD